MARFAALLCVAAAAMTSVGAAVIPGVPGPSSSLITFYTSVNYAGSAVTFVDEKTTGCIGATAPFISSLSSVKLDQSGIACNLWSEPNCAGAVGIVVAGDIPSLIPYGFNDKMQSYNCYSTA
ncbi:hypothetical protein B0H16DRAFT_1592727 [Mycena metata]|uniref:Uncharacterized protein n=1 Tax=Mycena metata TaxID=1033252 RepID=A0AAD7HR71_9AGAR|nr:hypothetical protein B0H16DRAFT_1592727 [Mycena metata]